MIATLLAVTTIFTQPEIPIDLTDTEKQLTIQALLDHLDKNYVFSEKARMAKSAIESKLKAGDYQSVNDPNKFAAQLHQDINVILNDAHFRIRYSETPLPVREEAGEPSPEEIAEFNNTVRRLNAGIDKVERLPCNIGYVEVRSFMAGKEIARPAQAAFEFLADTDALIIDLRRNGGGDPEAIQILCSYLFSEEPVHLNSIYNRPENQTTEYWTLRDIKGPRYLNKPVFALTSKRTGSGAEECAYNIQTQKRGTIVGEVTWGGANPGGNFRLNDHFSAFIPTGRAINPITKTNWEGVGVQPDVPTTSDRALDKAQVLALEELLNAAQGDWKNSIAKRIEELKKGKDDVLLILREIAAGV